MQISSVSGLLITASLVLLLQAQVSAQFNSGSTGADGALDLSTMNCPGNTCYVQLPESGILNYTTVNIPGNKSLGFRSNSRNTPVVILAQGNVTVSGSIFVGAPFLRDNTAGTNTPGPGGFYGGTGGNSGGFGPGGGQLPPGNPHGKWIGPLLLNPIVGGSGGASIVGSYGAVCNGGGGGGAILIASSSSIQQIGGNINANGNIYYTNSGYCASGNGSGGAIRLVSNSINITGSLSATGGGNGVVRIEATNLSFTGTSNPAAVLSPINPQIGTSDLPQLRITSVGGSVVPSYAGTRFDTVDLLLPNQIPDPVNVVVGANNIPTGTQVNVGFVNGSLSGTSTPCSLSGTLASSSCTATISNLNRTGVTYLLATAAFDPPGSAAAFNPKGDKQVAKVKIEAVLGGQAKYVFLDRNGKEIVKDSLKKEFLSYFGM